MTATEWTPTLEDFENWTDDDEQSALDAIASRMKIRHIIKNDEYWALAPRRSHLQAANVPQHPRFRGPLIRSR